MLLIVCAPGQVSGSVLVIPNGSIVVLKRKKKKHDIIYMWKLKYDINELIYKTETDWQT